MGVRWRQSIVDLLFENVEAGGERVGLIDQFSQFLRGEVGDGHREGYVFGDIEGIGQGFLGDPTLVVVLEPLAELDEITAEFMEVALFAG